MIKEEIFKEIQEEMIKNGSWDAFAKLQCVSDGILTYRIENDEIITEVNIISDDAFWSIEEPVELLRKKRISYLEHSIYLRNGNQLEKIACKQYRPIAELGLN